MGNFERGILDSIVWSFLLRGATRMVWKPDTQRAFKSEGFIVLAYKDKYVGCRQGIGKLVGLTSCERALC